MPSDFADVVGKELSLEDIEVAIIRKAGVRTAEELDSLVRTFPSLSMSGLQLPRVTAYTGPRTSGRYAAATALAAGRTRAATPRGAKPPPGTRWGAGAAVPMPTGGRAGSSGAPPAPPPPGRIDLRRSAWPIRDQGQRSTCVAFAATACAEFRAPGQSPASLSEQFLYWAIKMRTTDPWPTDDGTRLEFARDAARSHGICADFYWPYSGTYVPGNISHDDPPHAPSSSAIADAAGRRFAKSKYRAPGASGGGAAAVLKALGKGRPVAITVPVFADLANPGGPDNWTTPSAWAYGRVIDPPPSAVATSAGHAICVVGFEPDVREPKGGYFVFRNSWSVAWASAAPAPGTTYAPEPGYGEISATYLDDYLWELFQL